MAIIDFLKEYAKIRKQDRENKVILIFAFAFFMLGLYYYSNSYKYYEQMENKTTKPVTHSNARCPNMLIEKDGGYYLYNSKLAIVPGVNPIKFDSLEDYSEFIEWQNSQNIHCPILYLQYSTDAQNNELIQVKPSIFENQGGLPSIQRDPLNKDSKEFIESNKILDATRDNNTKFNTNMLAGIDTQNQTIGLETSLDKMFYQNGEVSVNPMDPKWGGKEYTQNAVDNGEFEERYVVKNPIPK
jgi:hypothetical protein